MKKSNGLIEIIRKNAWAIFLILLSWIVGFALLQQQVNALSIKIAEYPSSDYFELKFENIDKNFEQIERKLDKFDK